MHSYKHYKEIFVAIIVLLLLAGCTTATPPEATAPVVEEQPTPTTAPTPTTDPPLPTFSPDLEIDWDDRSIYAANLLPDAQDLLQENPKASVYHITLDIPTDLPAPLTGTLIVRYFNQETSPLEEIYFRLFAYIYGGKLQAEDVKVYGAPVETELESENTALKVSLPEPLPVGESVVISMNFTLELPTSLAGSYGLLGYFNETLTLDTFYPIIPAYDEKGWYRHTPYPNGDVTYQDTSYYKVQVHAPADFVLASTGVEIERSTEDDFKTLTFAAGPVRDFYLAGSSNYTKSSKAVNGILINSYAHVDQKKGQTRALDAAGNALVIFSDLFGPYPYAEFDIVNAPMLALGIEYPGITNIFYELYNTESAESEQALLSLLETVIAHEVGHQWFYNMVGNDQQEHPWLDESVTQYITYLYTVEQYGETASQSNINNWETRLGGVENKDKAVGLPAKMYDGAEYSGIVYGRGPLFFLDLQNSYSRQMVIDGLRDYFQSNIWQHGEEEELRASLEDACECSLNWAFEAYIYRPQGNQ